MRSLLLLALGGAMACGPARSADRGGPGAAARRRGPAAAPTAAGPRPPSARSLPFPSAGSAGIERRLAGGASDSYEIDLADDEYLHASFDQHGIDLAVDVFAPDHRRLLHVDSPNEASGPEEVHLVAEAAGRYRFAVTAPPGAPPGRYRVRLRARRRPRPLDRRLAAAHGAFHAARELDRHRAGLWETIARYEQAIFLFQEVGERWLRGYAHLRIGRLYLSAARPREALDFLSRAERLFTAARDLHLATVADDEIGSSYLELADFEGAGSSYRRALALARRTGEASEQATALHNLGKLSQLRGRFREALAFFRESLETWERLPGNRTLANRAETLAGIGWIYTSLGEWQRAYDAQWSALLLRNRLGNAAARGVSLTQIGDVLLYTEPARALPYLERAWDLERRDGAAREQAITLTSMGLALRQLGRYTDAHATYRKVLQLYGSLSDPAGEAAAWIDLGWTSVYLGQPVPALGSFEKGFDLARRVRDREAESRALLGMAAAERERGNLPLAQARAEASLAAIERLRADAARPDLQVSYLAANENAFSLLLQILMERRRLQPRGGFEVAGLWRSEQARARGLLDSLRASRQQRAELQAGVSPALLARRRALLASIARRDAEWRSPASAPAEAAAAQRELADLLDRLAELEAEISRSTARPHPGLDPPHLGDLQRNLLDRGTLLLEYYLGTPHSYLWAVTADAVESFQLPGRETLESLVRPTVARLAGPGTSPGEDRSAELSRALLGPVAHRIAGKRLLIAADDTLQYLPFAALPDPGGPGPLLLRHEIAYVPSLAVLAELRERQARRAPPPLPLAILADPVFEATDPRLAEAAPPSSATRSLEPPEGFLPRLRWSRREADAIASLLPAGRALAALDFAASRDLVISGRLSRYRMLHMAAHGVLRADHPELSALVLSRFDRRGRPRDGDLRVSDLAGVSLPADLVVLSACSTALGEEIPGEGLLGLPQAFLTAGATRVVVSLWQVEEESTAALMERFYRGLLVERLPPATALRNAQLSIRAQSRWSSPRYWAGFILEGDWR